MTITSEQIEALHHALATVRRYDSIFIDLDGWPSFEAMRMACKVATALGRKVNYLTMNGAKEVAVSPGDDPHALYKASIGVERAQ